MFFEFVTNHLSLMYELTGVFAFFFVLMVIGAVLLMRFEHVGFEEALYFAVVTALTVGFGDVTPHSRGGRLVTIVLAFLGLVLVGIFVAIAGQALELAMAHP